MSGKTPNLDRLAREGMRFTDYSNDFFAREFWRFVMVQQYVTELARAAIDYPPMQAPASFNLDEGRRRSSR
jgi:hypothetical protein